MFNTNKAPALPTKEFAFVEAPKGGTYFAVRDQAKNGNIDATYLLLAYAFDQGWTNAKIHASYSLSNSWWIAVEGLRFLGSTLPGGFTTSVSEDAEQEARASSNLFEVAVKGDTPPLGNVLDTGDIFTPNANGFHNIPRLYLMAALVLEEKQDASVAALVVNAGGLVIALGTKAHGEGGCGHAEVKALFSIKGQVPDRCMLFSTLKPCTMCAGLIQALFSGNCKQYWARGDPSNGADYKNVTALSLPSGLASSQSEKDRVHVRQIKLQDGRSFTDAFSTSWTGRDQRVRVAKAGLADRRKEAFETWCEAVIRPKQLVGKSKTATVRVKDGTAADIVAKAKKCGDATSLSKRSDIFERVQSGSNQIGGLKNEDFQIIVDAFNGSSYAKAADKPVKDAEKEQDMGIIQYISAASGSKGLRVAARNALSQKFVKYGKSVTEVQGVTGANVAAPTGPPTPSNSNDVRMAKIASYLFDFLKTQK
jgi:tRNA(Arg) A34 adenosine deaminase TadA